MDEHRHSRTNTDETDWMDGMDGVSQTSDLKAQNIRIEKEEKMDSRLRGNDIRGRE